jgi:NADPH:quinone reductase-like Zn-dependent oxidoreductase
MPRDLDFAAAAAVPLAGLTALRARDELGVKPGQKKLAANAVHQDHGRISNHAAAITQ